MATILSQLDAKLDRLFADWNTYSTIIVLLLIAFVVYLPFSFTEPDSHPFLLGRQASASHVRHPGESAIYRSLEVPQGYPLRSGLAVKDPGAPKWASGRNGDLRDIWRQAVRGTNETDGGATKSKGKLFTVLGREDAIEHDFGKLTQEINTVGQHIQETSRVALYLPNSVELLVMLFAAAFYGFTPILIPQGQPLESLAEILHETDAGILLAPAGTLPLDDLLKATSRLKEVIWVVERTSRHMDFSNALESKDQRIQVSLWHDIIDRQSSSASPELPSKELAQMTGVVTAAPMKHNKSYEIVEFTQENLVAAVAAQLMAGARAERFNPKDLLVPLDSLSLPFSLSLTLAALFSNASVALTSVAGPTVSLSAAFQKVFPTIIVASPETLAKTHADKPFAPKGPLGQIRDYFRARALAVGKMPKKAPGDMTDSLRLIYVADRAGADSLPLSANELFDLRLWTGARIIYALTVPKVAGAIAQTLTYDYRKNDGAKRNHFGPPMSCVEVKLLETKTHKIPEDGNPVGQLVVSGPAVAGGFVNTELLVSIREDSTVAYI